MFGPLEQYIAVFLTALLVTYLLTPRVRALACRYGVVDLPGERRAHKHPTARGGGLAVVIGVHVGCLVALAYSTKTRPGDLDFHWWLSFAPASLILLVVGVVDDVRGMAPWMKLGGQVLAASVVCLSGTKFGSLLGYELPPWLDGVMVVFWIVAIINAFNLIDGLDGLASGLAIIASVGLCGILVLGHLPGVVLVLLALAGACLAFLRYNFHPATIFLGDTGSMFIGFTLGVVSLQTFTKNTFFLSLAIPMLVLGIPIYDALLAIWRRSVRRLLSGDTTTGGAKRAGIMTADVEHLHHRLSKAGLSTRRVATFLFILNTALVVFGLLLTTFQSHFAGIFLLAMLAAVYVLLRHMAVIELRDTGRLLMMGLARPTHALLKSFVYPFWDVFCLAGSLAFAMAAFEPHRPQFWHDWFMELPIWVTPTFSLLALSRTYVTIWTRVRVIDVLMLLLTLQGGLVLSLGIALLIDPEGAFQSLHRALVIAALGNLAMIAVRVVYPCVEEVVHYLSAKSVGTNPERVVLYGAGGRCELFLKDRSHSFCADNDGRQIVGLIDDEPSLHGKWAYGHFVLGGLPELPKIIRNYRIAHIVITAGLRPEAREVVWKLATEHGIRLSEWQYGHTLLQAERQWEGKAEVGDQRSEVRAPK